MSVRREERLTAQRRIFRSMEELSAAPIEGAEEAKGIEGGRKSREKERERFANKKVN